MKLFSGFMAVGAVGLSLAFTAPASAQGQGDNFSVDQSCGASSLCSEAGGILTNIDRVNFTYTARIDQANDGGLLNGDPFVEKGFANWTGYINDVGGAVPGTFLNADYQVYMVFSATGTAATAFDQNNNPVGINATFSSFLIDIYMSDDLDTALAVPATTAGSVTNQGVAVTPGSLDGDDQHLAHAELLSTGIAHLFGGLANGDFEIQVTDLGLALFGPNFLTDPSPFYTIMNFAGNTGQVVPPGSLTQPFSSVATGDGQMFFSGVEVPEPATLGLLGGGLLGMAALLRRRRQAA